MAAFLVPSIIGAIVLLAQHAAGVANVTRFPTIVSGQPLTNMLLGILAYLPVAAVVPLALLLLTRTGQPPTDLGLGRKGLRGDLLPAIGLTASSYGVELVMIAVLSPLLILTSSLVTKVPLGHIPKYYLIWGLAISATTAVAEEVLVNGYLLTRLDQLGWSPRKAFIVSLALRTSYHVYYGLGFIFTIPLGFFVTRSFQKHRRLNRAIVAHFVYDAVLFAIVILK